MKRSNLILFLLGLFGELHVRIIGSIALSEFLMFMIAPVVFIIDIAKLRRNGFLPYILCVCMAMLGCVISSIVNNTPFPLAIRGFAGVYSLFAIPIVFHHYLVENLNGFKWVIIGFALSCFITIFGFQSAVDLSALENATAGERPELYYAKHFGGLVSIWYKGWYLQCPTAITAFLMLMPATQIIISSASGRSALLASLMGLFLHLYVRRNVFRMRKLKKNVIIIGAAGICIVLMVTQAYKYAAVKGMLNEAAQRKYVGQTKKGSGPMALIMSGRSDFFIGLMACLDRPAFGFGPWAPDEGGYYTLNFLSKYGDYEDYKKYYSDLAASARMGFSTSLLPAHSHIVGFWLWYGILALPLWPYVLKKTFEYLHSYMDAVPQWFGIVALTSPGMLWSIFFSPFGGRFMDSFYITTLLISIAVGKGVIRLPREMQVTDIRSFGR